MCEAMKEFIWEHYGDEIMKEKQASFTNGTQNGERKVNTLILKLSELGRIDDILNLLQIQNINNSCLKNSVCKCTKKRRCEIFSVN